MFKLNLNKFTTTTTTTIYLVVVVVLAIFNEPIKVAHCNDDLNNSQFVAESLCNNKHIEITKISQIKNVINFLKLNEQFNCNPKIRESILDLDETINKDLNDVCTYEKVENIRNYHEKYISINSDEPEKNNLIPKSLRNFFLGFGIKVSYICKKNMINSLLYDPHKLLDENDFKMMQLWTNKADGMMNDIMGSPTDYDDLLLASDLSYIKSDSGPSKKDEKLFIQTATGKLIEKIQISCTRRFKPFYKKLILPLVTLANLGYNFQGEELERELNEMKTNSEVNQWYRIVYLCESLDDMEIVEDDSNQQIESEDQKVVKILTKAEADKIKLENGGASNRLKKINNNNNNNYEQLKQIDYTMEGKIPIEDVVIDNEDKNVLKLINSFDAKKKEADRIRTKVFRKMGKFVTNILKNKKIKFVTDFFKQKLSDNEPSDDDGKSHAKEDMIYAIDDFVQLKSEDVGDLPVAGVRDYIKRIHHNAVYTGPSGVANGIKNGVQRWTFKKIFWYIMATLVFAIGVALFMSAVG